VCSVLRYPLTLFFCQFFILQIERAVLRRKEERDIDSQLMGGATSKEELEKATIIKMKNVTGEKDDSVCIALLKDNGYNMKESIEAYLEI
jgi:hypothetical protein